MVQVRDVLNWIDTFAPFDTAETWDNVGLLVGDFSNEVKRLLITLDVDNTTMDEAIALNCDCIVSHHPILFGSVSSIISSKYPDNIIYKAIREGISIIAAHTNLDSSFRGTNTILASVIGLKNTEPLYENSSFQNFPAYRGIGLIGFLDKPIRLEGLLSTISRSLNGPPLFFAGNREGLIHRVAVCSGSGASVIKEAIRKGADCLVTGEVKYHDAQFASYNGLSIVGCGHFASEALIVPHLVKLLKEIALKEKAEIEICEATSGKDIFQYYFPHEEEKH